MFIPVNGEIQPLITDERIRFEKMFKTLGKLRSILEESMEYIFNERRKTERYQHVTGWIWIEDEELWSPYGGRSE